MNGSSRPFATTLRWQIEPLKKALDFVFILIENSSMKKLICLLSFVPVMAFAGQTKFDDFKGCYRNRSSKIPSAAEKSFLDSYLRYLETGKDSDGRIATEKLLELQPKDKTLVKSKWIGIFEGSAELCCSGPSSCSYSFGSASSEKLMPKIKKGNRVAINLVLTYSTLVETDGAESENLGSFQKVVRKHRKAVGAYVKANKNLLESHSINWLVD